MRWVLSIAAHQPGGPAEMVPKRVSEVEAAAAALVSAEVVVDLDRG